MNMDDGHDMERPDKGKHRRLLDDCVDAMVKEINGITSDPRKCGEPEKNWGQFLQEGRRKYSHHP